MLRIDIYLQNCSLFILKDLSFQIFFISLLGTQIKEQQTTAPKNMEYLAISVNLPPSGWDSIGSVCRAEGGSVEEERRGDPGPRARYRKKLATSRQTARLYT